jgi:hypothetical protein
MNKTKGVEGRDNALKKHKTNKKDLKGLKEGIMYSENTKQIENDLRGLRERMKCLKNKKQIKKT